MKVASDYRALALDVLNGNWKTAILTGFVANILGASIVNGYGNMTSRVSQNTNVSPQEYASLLSQPGGRLLQIVIVWTILWSVVTLIVGGAVRLGYARFNLKLVDKQNAEFSNLFSQKKRLWNGFCMNFLQGLYTALWTLLLVVPGIIKTYSYAMTPYIMAEHPNLTANEAITESRRIMDGNKWRLFCMEFSFIGWELLCALGMLAGYGIFAAVFSGSEAMGVALVMLLQLPLSVGFFILWPYEEAARAAFYRDIMQTEY